MTRHTKFGLAILVAFIFGFAGAAQATSFSLGNISGPGTHAFGNNKDPGPFTDRVHFVIDPGVTLTVKVDAKNEFWRHGGIDDMDGTLSGSSGVILNGDAITTFPLSSPYPIRLVTFADIVLGPGHYFVSIFGTANSDVGGINTYSGTIQFGATPLPASLLMMLTALGGFGLLGWRRIGKSAAAAS
jgi:hypothetical protein